tara:strand:+ start:295 stop:870 length:576 start_codon:yes stop_codon:yes gene_type:complete
MKKILFIILAFSLLAQCGIYRKTDARKIPGNVNDRVQKNLEEGKRIRFGSVGNKGGGNFSFATSNEMWRATIEILDFIPLNNADYGGGIIITDWYNEDGSGKDSIKIMVRFLSNEIRADGLKVTVYNKSCKLESGVQNCKTQIDETGQISQELKLAILKRAAVYKTTSIKKEAEDFNKNRKPVNVDREGLD